MHLCTILGIYCVLIGFRIVCQLKLMELSIDHEKGACGGVVKLK